MVRIRIVRIGRTNRPCYRVGVYDSHTPRNGKCLENLGFYDPLVKEETKKNPISIKLERVQHWLSLGACPTPKAYSLLKKAGVKFANSVKQESK